MLKELKEKSVLILGFGREGRSSYNFLRNNFPRKKLAIADQKEKKIDDENTKTFFGDGYLEAVKDYEIIIKSPGVPRSNLPKTPGKITSQTDIFLKTNRDEVIGVTGTKGKSTTCKAIKEILTNNINKKVHLVGNIGEPALGFLDKDGVFVYEMSSFQLQEVSESPGIAVLLNLFRDHLDQHEDFQEYFRAKKNITKFQTNGDVLIYNPKNKWTKKIAEDSAAKLIPFNPEKTLNNSAVYLEPILKTVKEYGVLKKKAIQQIKNISKLPHRLEKVGEWKGIKFFDDSASTIPQAAVSALENLKVATLITGGVDKGGSYKPLTRKVKDEGVETVICFPETGEKIKHLLEENNFSGEILKANSMEEAVKKAYELTKKGGTCVLSPASSSFNMFDSYKHRGELFKKFVKRYGEK